MARRLNHPPGPGEEVADILRAIDRTGEVPALVEDDPGSFFLKFFKAWYDNGGKEGGKPRNSIRRMRQEWLTGVKTVKSLHPKLTGQVKMSREDGRRLIELFLSRWTHVGFKKNDAAVTSDGYLPLASDNPERLVERLTDALFGPAGQRRGTGLLLPTSKEEDVDDDSISQESVNSLISLIREADAAIFVSSRNTVVGPSPAEGMRRWWHLIKNFSENNESKNNLFIWVIDVGNRKVEEEGTFADYLNAGMLALHFAAFANFSSMHDQEDSTVGPIGLRLSVRDSRKRLSRWDWLERHAAIVIRSRSHAGIEGLYREEDEPLSGLKLEDVGPSAEHVLPRTVPSNWAKPLGDFYQTAIDDLAEATLSIVYSRPEDNKPDLRYLAATNRATAKRPIEPADEASSFVTIDLPSPGRIYDDAFRLLYFAAMYRLHAENSDQYGTIAAAFLRNLGFQVLRVSDFVKIFGSVES